MNGIQWLGAVAGVAAAAAGIGNMRAAAMPVHAGLRGVVALTAAASTSSDVKGDFDCDRDVDFCDFMAFVDVFGLADTDPEWLPMGPRGDFEPDGDVDALDFTEFTGVYGEDPPPFDFVDVQGTRFVLNGETFRFVGANNYYLMQRAAAGGTFRDQVDQVIEHACTLGLTVMRTWGFNHGLYNWDDPAYADYAHQPSAIRGEPGEPAANSNPLLVEPAVYEHSESGLLQLSPAVINEDTFQGLDYVIYKARGHGIRLILPLINGGGLTNTNYEYGGRGLFVAWTQNPEYYSGSDAVPAVATDEFYTHPATTQWYRDYIAMMLNRVNTYTGIAYKDDPTILAWELGNELMVTPTNAADFAAWIDEMGEYIHTHDPNHLVTVGAEGLPFADEPYGSSGFENRVGIRFSEVNQSAFVDFTTGHLLRDNWGWGDLAHWTGILDWQIGQSGLLGKPFVLEEFNLRADLGAERRKTWWEAYFGVMEAGADPAGGDLFWNLCHDTYPDYDNYTMYYPASGTIWNSVARHRQNFVP